jgi:hypothetical protein
MFIDSQMPSLVGVRIRDEKSIKYAGSYNQKSKNLKNFYLLFSNRLTPITNPDSLAIFDSNVHVRPIIEARLFVSPAENRPIFGKPLGELFMSYLLTVFTPLEVRLISLVYFLMGPKPYPLYAICSFIRQNLYNCRENSTNHPILCKTNPISGKPKMNINTVNTKGYENNRLRSRGENKPNQTQFYNPALEKKFLDYSR